MNKKAGDIFINSLLLMLLLGILALPIGSMGLLRVRTLSTSEVLSIQDVNEEELEEGEILESTSAASPSLYSPAGSR